MRLVLPGCKPPDTRYVGGVKISVIVPAFNEEKLLGASLAEIKKAANVLLKPAAGGSS